MLWSDCVPVVPANLDPLFITSFLAHPLATQGAHTCFHLLITDTTPSILSIRREVAGN